MLQRQRLKLNELLISNIIVIFRRLSQLIIIIIRHSLLELFQNVIGVRFFETQCSRHPSPWNHAGPGLSATHQPVYSGLACHRSPGLAESIMSGRQTERQTCDEQRQRDNRTTSRQQQDNDDTDTTMIRQRCMTTTPS